MKQILITIFTLVFFVSTSCGQTKIENDTLQQINTYLTEIEKVGFNGSVLVELNGKKVISDGYGFADKERQLKNSSTTIFDIGSITKQFTAAAMLKLEMQGKLSTDDKLSKFFENLPKDKETITIHDLLRHQSGLISNIGKDYEEISREEFLKKVLSSELKFKVGSDFSYSNIGYSLLAMIIEKVSGQTYETYLYENLWKPSKMKMTGYSRPGFDRDLIAVGYYRDDRVWGKPTDKAWENSAPYWHLRGNGGILSTTEDLYKWHKALTGDLILSIEAKNKLYHPKIRTEENYNSIYAYGWDVSITDRNTTQVWHNGGNNILYADFLRHTDEGTTLIMLTNKSHPNFDELNQEISQIIFNPKYIPVIPVADNEINRNFANHILSIIQELGLEKAKEAYQKKGNSENLLEFMMRNEGLNHLYNGKPDLAIQIFQMNVFVHPKVAKALQALGEGYMETGKKELALKFFKESLSINPDNPFANEMIKKLKEQKDDGKPYILKNEKISKEIIANDLADSISTFLVDISAGDFSKQKHSDTEFRNSRIGYKLSTSGEKVYFLCGEYRTESGGLWSEWTSFSTIKTSGYEQWLGSQAYHMCQDSSMVWLNKTDFSESLKLVYDCLKKSDILKK